MLQGALQSCWCNEGIQIYPMASGNQARVTAHGLQYQKVVCCCALSPMQFSS